MDYVINRANELGLVMGLVTAKSWHVSEHPEKVFDEKNAYVFGKFLGERYKNNARCHAVNANSSQRMQNLLFGLALNIEFMMR